MKELRQKLKQAFDLLRLSSLQGKLIVPYVMLTAVIAGLGIFVITRLVTSTMRERLVNQTYEAARVAADAIVRQERVNLENLRLLAYTRGVSEAIAAQNADALEGLLLPVAFNNGIEVVTVVNLDGVEILTLGQKPSSVQYLRTQGTDLSSKELVSKALAGVADEQGDKYAGIMDTGFGPALFTGSPVYNADERVVGGILVGARLDTLVPLIQKQALADIIIINPDREIIDITLAEPDQGFAGLESLIRSTPEQDLQVVYDLQLDDEYKITFAELLVRQERLGWLGIVLPSSYVVSTEATSRDLFILIFTLGTVAVIFVGYGLSQSIARPILKLRDMTQSVAAGDLEQHIGLERQDEIGELADAFDAMTMRLRERTMEAARLYAEAIERNRELAETNERLRSTQLQLIQSEKLAAIGQLTAGIVHDVKNPLTVIKGVAELLLSEDGLSQEYQHELSLIRESALKANNIVGDLLKFARQSQPEMSENDMRETVEAALRLAAYSIRKAHVRVVKDLPEQVVMMTYDYQQIEQVLMNLISNAVQAMPDGGTLRIALSQADGVTAIAVQDSGVGISAENLGRIFDPFYTTKPAGEGTGLGLSVSYGIVSNHSGRIEVESAPGKGSTFTIVLPVNQPETSRQPELVEAQR
ncbi:MAG: HAMP domain-containing protein [Anaerolineales bacterium]|nr:HAMP domain-containing protein [Anaerolineales bacterium]